MELENIGIDNNTVNDFIEMSMCLPFYDLLYGFFENYQKRIDKEKYIWILSSKYGFNINEENIITNARSDDQVLEIYHSSKNRGSFFCFDHFKEPTDQNDMIKVVVRVLISDFDYVFRIFKTIYMKSGPRCNLQVDHWNQSYYRKIFNSQFYMKKQKQFETYDIQHFNLERFN